LWYKDGSTTGITTQNYAPGALTASSTFYCAVTSGSCGTVNTSTTSINVNANLSASISGGTTPICYNTAPGTFTATGSGGTGSYTYLWYKNGVTTGITTQTYAPGALTASSNFYCAVTSGSCGTVNTSTTSITVNTESTAPTSISGTSTLCNGTQTILTAVGGSDGTGASYEWYAGGCASGSILSVTNTLTVTPGSSTTYFVRRTGTCNTTACASQLVTVNPLLPASVSIAASQNPTCAGVTGIFTASPVNGGTPSYQWLLNGSAVGANSNEYSNENVLNADIISCVMTSTATCATGSPATSNAINMTVATPPTTSLIGNDYVWSGNFDSNWENSANWLIFNGTNYAPAPSIPDNTKNVFLRAYAPCASNPAATTATSTVSCHNLTIETGLSLGNVSILNVSGDWNNNGTFVAGTGIVEFNGTSTQNINAGASNFNDVTFNNTANSNADIIINTPMTIQGVGTFTNGILNYSGTGYLTFGDNASSNGGSANSFVDATVTKTGSTAFLFPIGDVISRDLGNGEHLYKILATAGVEQYVDPAPTYAEIQAGYVFSNIGEPDWWEHGGNMDDFLSYVSDREFWTINSTKDINVTLYWSGNTHANGDVCIHGFCSGDNVFDATDLVVSYWNGSKWMNSDFNSGASNISHDQGYIQSRYVVPFGAKGTTIITFGSKKGENPLPVELLDFNATCDNENVTINWTTASEINNDYFIVEKSTDMISFVQVNKTTGAGNSNSIKNYQVIDKNDSQTTYYRLTQVDYDGKTTVFAPVVVNCGVAEALAPSIIVYPNPFREEFTIYFENFESTETITIEVFDQFGQIVQSFKGANTVLQTLNLGSLKPAIYTLRITSDDKVFSNKIIKN
jgi:hypothetical protein